MSLTQICIRSYFNPRSHEGSDAASRSFLCFSALFQSTLPRGERLQPGQMVSQNLLFQSTLPRGERPSPSRTTTRRCNFNPRSHEGSDVVVINGFSVNQVISIHAPTRGATSRSEDVALTAGFQSTLPRGERPFTTFSNCLIVNFNPRSHEGSDFHDRSCSRYSGISIHAPTRGATEYGISFLIL